MDTVMLDEVFSGSALARLKEIVDLPHGPISGQALRERDDLAATEILVTGWGAPQLDAGILERMPALKVIVHSAGSIRNLVSQSVWDRGIRVSSMVELNNEPVSEFVYAEIVLALKDVHRRSAILRAQRILPPLNTAHGIYGATIGLVSFGSIARKIRDRLSPLNADVITWDPLITDEDANRAGVRRAVALEDVFRESDVVSVHAPWIPGITDKLIGREQLQLLKPGASFINTARGALVDEDALVDVMTERTDLFAILDVTWPEPPMPDSALYTLPNVHLTGHAAGSIGSERTALGDGAISDVERYLNGLPLLGEITEAVAKNRA
ncbi:hydroxyacid dehydrogenase [Arthrobacter sp. CDRTa11]|uniref:hydroxyacid dehydrogenase n=1 Tax=Arthrobacter sp. CDRTa11 TaxID=2651199 RepID=UPI002265982D|nr:hydroxyacid dehydrogenase [Arthrobacter sp. CDRTa11]